MKCWEIINEDRHAGYQIVPGKHFEERIKKRGVSWSKVTGMLGRLDRVKRRLEEMPTHVGVNLYDRTDHTHLVVMKSGDEKRLLLITAYRQPNPPLDLIILPIR
jgi:hypothetical protein